MTFSIDTNVLFYAFDADVHHSAQANRIMVAALSADCLLTNQVLGEFLNVTRRKRPERVREAGEAVLGWSLLLPIAPTSTEHLVAAGVLAQRHRLQFWDSVVLVAAAAAGAEFLLTEDMHDGAVINGIRLMNPFDPANAAMIDTLLTPSP